MKIIGNCIAALCLTFISSALGFEAADIAKARSLYEQHSGTLEQILGELRSHQELKNISQALDPVRDIEFIPKNGQFDNDSVVSYKKIVEMMGEIGLERVSVDRFVLNRGIDVEVYRMVVATAGIGETGRALFIEYSIGLTPNEYLGDSGICESLSDENWFVCKIE